jgi:hypothetical protein
MQMVRLCAAISAAILAGSLVQPYPSAAATHSDPASTDKITYQRDLAYMPGARLQAEKGKRTSDGSCRFESKQRNHISTGPQVLVFTEVAYEQSTCTRTLASARYAPNAVPPAIAAKLSRGDTGDQRVSSGTSAPKAAKSATSATSAIPYVGQGNMQIWYEDPVYIDLSLTRSTLQWNWSYPDLLLAGTTWHEAYWYWFGLSGWRLDSSNRQFYNDGDLAATDTIGHFSNPIFCLGDTTYADHFQTLFYAADFGYWGWSYIIDKRGGCSGPIQMPGFYSWAITVV